MAGFKYFIPNHPGDTISPKQLEEIGIAYAFDNSGRKTPVPVHGASPSGGPGLMVADHERVIAAQIGYWKDRQIWREHPSKKFWVGYDKDSPPTPDDLVRAETLPGVNVRLADGRDWQIPIARRWSASDDPANFAKFSLLLPAVLDLDNTGKIVLGDVLPRYGTLWGISQAWVNINTGLGTEADKALLDGDSAVFAAATVLQGNYVVGFLEAMMLKLFDQHNWETVLRQFNDWDTAEVFLEKKRRHPPAGPSSSSGPGDNSPITDPPRPT